MQHSYSDKTVCIRNADGKIIRFSQIRVFASAINFHYNKCGGDGIRPILFNATDPDAPLLIIACWLSGIPFFIKQKKTAPKAARIIHSIIKPVFCVIHDSAEDAFKPEVTIQKSDMRGFAPVEFYSISDDRFFAYLMTSGTSGEPKVVRLSRKHIIKAAFAASENVTPGIGNSWLLMLPLNHIGGVSVVLRSWLYGNEISDFRFAETQQIMHLLQFDTSVTMASMVPTQIIKILEMDDQFTTHKHFRAILLGGGPSSTQIVQHARKRKIPLMKSYGMTETCAQFTCVPYKELFETPANSSGIPLLGNTIEIRNQSGVPCSTGETGLIWLKGEQIMEAYLYPEEANKAFDENGWFNTYDFGYLDKEGHLFVEMRRTDLIVSGGENINPITVEQAIKQLDGIIDAAVVGVNDQKWGQRIVAFIVTDGQPFEPDEWRMALSKHLQPYEIPKEFRPVSSLPKNELGKLLRTELASYYT